MDAKMVPDRFEQLEQDVTQAQLQCRRHVRARRASEVVVARQPLFDEPVDPWIDGNHAIVERHQRVDAAIAAVRPQACQRLELVVPGLGAEPQALREPAEHRGKPGAGPRPLDRLDGRAAALPHADVWRLVIAHDNGRR